MYVYIYIYMYTYTYHNLSLSLYIYIYIYTPRRPAPGRALDMFARGAPGSVLRALAGDVKAWLE